MRVVFLGTPEFAVPSLRALIESPCEVVAVFTQPDRPSGRGRHLRPSPVKVEALKAGLAVHQPERIRSEEHRAFVEGLRADFLVVAAYGQILPAWMLAAARVAPVNVHGSLLPRYRGAAPVAWAILNGDETTGVTTMWMDEHMDTGGMLLRREYAIPEAATAGEVSEALSHLGAALILPTLEGLLSGTLRPEPQDQSRATMAPKITKEMGRVSWGRRAGQIHNLIRALSPWPLAHTGFRGRTLQLLRSLPPGPNAPAGVLAGTCLGIEGDALKVACGDGTALGLLQLRLADRGCVSGREFASGARLRSGEPLFEGGPVAGECP
jgi:methionyl-tRNA formyltransferase